MFCCGWGGNQFTPLLVAYRRLAGYSTGSVDGLLGAYVLGLVPGLLISGAVSDRHGRRPPMVAAAVLSMLASVALAFGTLGPVGLLAGRALTGLAVGTAMSVGTSWVKELSAPPFDPDADAGAGARRASLALTAGFGLGAGVAGLLTQWAPHPLVMPYLAHITVTLAATVLLLTRGPETRTEPAPGSWWRNLQVPSAGHRRFVRVVLPMAPWVFTAAGIAYAVIPSLNEARLGDNSLLYATLLTVSTLTTGVAVQPLARRLDSTGSARAVICSMALMTVGVLVAVVEAAIRVPWFGLVAAVVLGASYGIAVVSGLLEIQRIAAPDELAGLTGVYYSLTYLGFLLPAVLAFLARWASYPAMLAVLGTVAAACTLSITRASRRHLPA
jgi:MFS family permease